MSGDIYDFNGHICQCINGAESHDKQYRKEGISWWPQEAIDILATKNIFEQLERARYNVNYVFTHTGGSKVAQFFGFSPTESDFKLDRVFQLGLDMWHPNYKHYCGHYHIDRIIDNKTRVVYNDIIEIY